MRKLVLTRGHQGSGKSHALRAAGLGDWTLSADMIRTVLASPVMVEDGRMILNQDVNEKVFPLMKRLAEERMRRGETLAIDTTMQERRDLAMWAEMAREHRYEVAVLDMSSTSLEAAIARNAQRPETRRVPEWKIRQVHAQHAEAGIRDVDGVTVIQGRDDGSHVDGLLGWLRSPAVDLSRYSAIVHVGDLQGCLTVLSGPGGPLEHGFSDDMFYVFVGDLVDRGIENGKVVRWWLENALGRENVVLLWGNHEDHLHRWAKGQEAVSNEFALRTLPQLEKAGIKPADADAICAGAKEFLHYTWRGTEVLATHAGLSGMPSATHLVSLQQYSHGTGYWSDPVDAQWERNTQGVIQVHGHRNQHGVPVRATSRSFNLEDQVEFGGNLRTCTLGPDGWSVGEFRNAVFKPARERMSDESVMSAARRNERRVVPHWMTGPHAPLEIDEATLAQMRAHAGVREKSGVRFPHVASLNFTKKVFFDRSWDDVVVKARGLFFDTESRAIVARGYEKFFNVGEREETTLAGLRWSMRYPVTLYVKENGFLGNVGYDARTDSLFVASKSTADGAFADMFRKILGDTLGDRGLERLRRYLRDNEASMTFEVIDPLNDPHMIEYDAPKVVLLDVLRRTAAFEKASYQVLEAAGRKLGLEVKRRAMAFKTPEAFEGWFRKASSDLSYMVDGRHVEGFVVEDSAGFMTKVKLPYYSFWKQMRSMKDRIVGARERGGEFAWEHTRRPDGSPPDGAEVEMAHAFRDWCLEQGTEFLKQDVITLRRTFGQDFGRDREPAAPAP